jgi:acyl-CoA synthetase (AMP-forming)/AMP-acid ligase II
MTPDLPMRLASLAAGCNRKLGLSTLGGGEMSFDQVFEMLASQCAERGGATALLEATGRRLSYAELGCQVDCASKNLQRVGLRPGERVLFAVRPSLEAIVLILAILRSGGVVVVADLGMGDAVFAARMALVQPRWVVAESMLLALAAWRPVRALLARRGIALSNLAGLAGTQVIRVGRRWPGVPPSTSFAQLLMPPTTREPSGSTMASDTRRACDEDGQVATDGPRDQLAADQPALVVFTSGTTDAPKAVVHTRASIGASVRILAEHLAFGPDDVAYSGDLHVIVPALLNGAHVVIPRRGRFSPHRFWRALHRYGVTHAFSTPGDFLSVARHVRSTRQRLPARLRVLMLGAAPIDRAFLARVHDVVPNSTEVWCVYAMTEMLPVARVTLRDKLAFDGLGDLLGAPFPGVEARLAPDGELLLRGPHLFGGYFGQPPIVEHATGDLAVFDEFGRIVLLGRKKDMIIRGHQNVYPGLYEPTIAAIAGVRRCSLVGVYSDTAADERLVLAVEPEADQRLPDLERRLRAELRRGPRSIDLAVQPDAIIFTRLPVAGRSNKVDKRALRELIRQRLPPC